MAKINLFDLEPENIVGSMAGQKLYLYSMNNCGKTKVASKLPKALLMMCEPGGNGVKCLKVRVDKWSVFKDFVNQLTSEKLVVDPNDENVKLPQWELMQRKIQTVVIDTVDELVEYAETATCQEYGVSDLSEITGKVNGYSIYRKDFKKQINRLCSYGYTCVFIGHEERVTITDELTGKEYEFIQPKGSSNVKASTRFIRDICDFCIYLKSNGIDSAGNTILSTGISKQTKQVFARSRYDMQTLIEPFTAKNLEEAILKAIEKTAEEEGSEINEWKRDSSNYDKHDWLELIKPYFAAIGKRYPEKLQEIVITEIGEGRKLSDIPEEDLVPLENVFNKLVTFACDRNIIVD